MHKIFVKLSFGPDRASDLEVNCPRAAKHFPLAYKGEYVL